jgi:plasmid stabilization system protein ParE
LAEVFVRAHARRDILANAEYLEEHGSAETAQRFLDATQKTFEALARMPMTCSRKTLPVETGVLS